MKKDDKVKINKRISTSGYDPFTPGMEKYCGQTYHITLDFGDGWVKLNESSFGFHWRKSWLTLVNNNTENKS